MWSGDQNFKRWSADLPSPMLSNRAMTRIHIKNMHSWSLVGTLLFCIGWPSAVHRPTIGRQSGDILGIGRPSTDDRTTGHRQKFILCTCLLHKYVGILYCHFISILIIKVVHLSKYLFIRIIIIQLTTR